MRNDDCCAVKSTDGLFQHIFRSHIQMIGRLVENQQIDGLQEQAYHSQSATLSTTEHLHFLIRLLATKHKGTQDVIDAQAYLSLRHIVNRLEDGEVLVQQLCLVLGKIAYLYVMSYLQMTIKGNLAHDTFHQR